MNDEKIYHDNFLANIKLYVPYFLALVLIAWLLWHIFSLLIGNKSLIVLLELREQERVLEENIKHYQRQNAFLQKEIFEILGE